jgi:hypothetical protein
VVGVIEEVNDLHDSRTAYASTFPIGNHRRFSRGSCGTDKVLSLRGRWFVARHWRHPGPQGTLRVDAAQALGGAFAIVWKKTSNSRRSLETSFWTREAWAPFA